MSVQRWDSYESTPSPTGRYILHADHARIVAETAALAREAAYREMTDERHSWPGPRGFDYDKGYEQGKADAEQAHAAALAAAVAAARAEVVTVELVGDYATGYNAGLIEGDAKGRREGKRLAEAAAAPRTLTADDPEPAVGSVVLDRDQSVWQRVGSTEHSRWVNPFMGTREWPDVLARGPVRLIHDGEATP